MTETTNVSSRIGYFDLLRVVAAFLVMLLHTASACWYGTNMYSRTWLVLNGYKSITDHAVLLFVMISGTLFATRDVPLKKLYGKYILRMVCSLVFWALVYSISVNFSYGPVAVLKGALASHYHLWFLPMIIGLYCCQPLMKRIAASEAALKYFLILSFVFSFFIPRLSGLLETFAGSSSGIIQLLTLINARLDEMQLHLVLGYSFYFLLGYYINKTDLTKKIRIIIYALGILGIVSSMLLSMWESRLANVPMDTYHSNFSISVLLKVLATFVLFKYIPYERIAPSLQSFIQKLSKYSFGAYLIHALLLELLASLLHINVLSFFPLVSAPVIALGIFVLSFLLSALLNRIPFINKYIV